MAVCHQPGAVQKTIGETLTISENVWGRKKQRRKKMNELLMMKKSLALSMTILLTLGILLAGCSSKAAPSPAVP